MKNKPLTTEEYKQMVIRNTEKEIKRIVLNKELTFNQKFNRLKYFYLENYKPDVIGFYGNILSLKIAIVTANLEILANKGNKEAKELYNALKTDKEINEIEELKRCFE
jgi:homoserine dehydrogenase